MRDICDHIGASVGHLVRGRLAERVAELCANLNPGGAANPELIAGIVNFVFALNCTNVNLKPLNAMSIQLAEETYRRYLLFIYCQNFLFPVSFFSCFDNLNHITFVQFRSALRLLAQDSKIRLHFDHTELILNLRKRRQKVEQTCCCWAHQVFRHLK